MLPLIGFAAAALGIMAFDIMGSTDASDVDESLKGDNEVDTLEMEYLSLDTPSDDSSSHNSLDFVPDADFSGNSDASLSETLDQEGDPEVNLEIPTFQDDVPPFTSCVEAAFGGDGKNDLYFQSDLETNNPDTTEVDASEECAAGKEATGKITSDDSISGTDGDDSLNGVNVHIDIATGIVDLFGNSGESIFGGRGDDILAIGAGDFAVGGEGGDEFLVDGQLSGSETNAGSVPIISDFSQGQDRIVVSIPTSEQQLEEVYPGRPSNDFDVSFESNEHETLIFVDGILVCKLVGEFALSSDDVSVQHDYHASLKTDFDERYGY